MTHQEFDSFKMSIWDAHLETSQILSESLLCDQKDHTKFSRWFCLFEGEPSAPKSSNKFSNKQFQIVCPKFRKLGQHPVNAFKYKEVLISYGDMLLKTWYSELVIWRQVDCKYNGCFQIWSPRECAQTGFPVLIPFPILKIDLQIRWRCIVNYPLHA